MRLLLRGQRLLQFLTQLLKLFDLGFFAGLQILERRFGFSELLAERHDRRVFRVRREQGAFFAKTLLAIGQALQAGFQLLDPRLLHFGLTARLGGGEVERIPLLLPAVHGGFGFFQRGSGLFGGGAGDFLLRGEHVQLFAEGQQQRAVVAQVRFGFQARALGLFQVILQLAQTLLTVLDALLDPGNVAADRVEAPLHQVEAFRQVVVPVTQALDACVGIALFGHQGFERNFLVADDRFTLADLIVQRLPAQGRQLGLELTLLALEFLILLGGLGLAVQAFELTLKLFAQVGQALKVLVGAADAVFGLAPTLLVLGDARRFFDEVAQVFGLGLDQLGDHPLLDDRVAARAKAGAEEDVGDVAAPAFGAVEVIGGLAVAGHFAANGDFRISGVLPEQGAVGVVEHQFDARLAHRLAAGGAVEDDVGHRLATEVLRRTLTHYPANGVDDVRFAAAIGPDHRRHVTGEVHRGRVDEGFEPRQLDALEPQDQASVKADITRSQLR
ncbi:hypothetical protein D3C73_662520 [compost metagenome]